MAESRRVQRGALRGLPSPTERTPAPSAARAAREVESCAASGPHVKRMAPREDARPSPLRAGIRVGLAFVGGLAGGVLGGGAVAVSLLIALSGAPPWIKVLATLGVMTSALAVLALVLWRIHAMLKRASRALSASTDCEDRSNTSNTC